jgi:probable rRNA maturation factor
MSDFKINFFLQDVIFPIKNKKKIKSWLIDLALQEEEGLDGIGVSVILCNDDYLLALNKLYLAKDTLTDIITFDYSDNKTLLGDIFISIDRIIENAREYSQPTEAELMRIMAHGMLHLCGYADKTKTEKSMMTCKEDLYLGILNSNLKKNDNDKNTKRRK